MLPTDRPAEFLITVFVLIAVPGPSVVFIVGRGIALGRGAAIATVIGNAGGFALQLLLVSFGLGAIVARSPMALTLMQVAGAVFIIYLGARNLISRHQIAASLQTGATAAESRVRALREGLAVGATNPKGVLTFTAVLPPFVESTQQNVTADIALLGSICIVMSLATDGTWALASGSAQRWLGNSKRGLERLATAGGVMLIGVGVALLFMGHGA